MSQSITPFELNPNRITINKSYSTNIKGGHINNKTTTCIDTIRYPESKLSTVVEADTMDMTTYIGAISQAYHFSNTGKVHGISAYMLLDLDGIPGNSSPISMVIKVYNIAANNLPTTMIDSAIVTVSDIGNNEQPLMFGSPIAVTDSFAIAIEINQAAPSNPYYVTNNSVNLDGGVEKLSAVTYIGVWYNSYILGGWDVDMMLSPIFEQDITASYTTTLDSILLGDSVGFTNTSISNTDKMFNRYVALGSPLYEWNFGDGTGTFNPTDSIYYYITSGGTYTSQLKVFNYGYHLNCIDSVQRVIKVTDPLTIGINHAVKVDQVINIYPIPAKQYINISVPSSYYGGKIVITNVVGTVVRKVLIADRKKVQILTENMNSGVYFISLDMPNERIFTSRIIIDK